MSTPLTRALTLINDMLSTHRTDDKTTIITGDRQEMWVAERDAIAALSQRSGFPIVEDHVQVLGTIGNLIERLRAENATLREKYELNAASLRESVSAQLRLVRANAQLRASNAAMQYRVFVPGTWHCDKCGFEQNNRVLNVASGNITAPTIEEVEVCPNDGETMRRVTWEECSQSNYEASFRFLDERDAARAELAKTKAEFEELEHGAELEALKKERSCVVRVRRWLSKL